MEEVGAYIFHIDICLCAGLHEFDTIFQRQLGAKETPVSQADLSSGVMHIKTLATLFPMVHFHSIHRDQLVLTEVKKANTCIFN